MILPADAQIVLFWGPQFIALYNDAMPPRSATSIRAPWGARQGKLG